MSVLRSSGFLRTITAYVVMVHLLLAQGMAASADFHHDCHDHSDDPCHECIVTLMTQGGYDQVLPDILPEKTTREDSETEALFFSKASVTPSHLLGGVLAQAPPRGP